MSVDDRDRPLQSDDDIGRLFDKKIAPELRSLEKERRAAVAEKRRRWRLGGGAVVALVLAVYLLCQSIDWSLWIALIPALIGAFSVWVWADMATSDYEGRLRKCFMSAICDSFDDLYYVHDVHDDTRDAFNAFDIKRFRDAHLIPSYDDVEFDDLLQGRYKDCRFQLVETELTSTSRNHKGGTTTRTVFDGLLFQLDVPRRVDGKIIIMRDYGSWINKMRGWWRDGLRVEIPHVSFEKNMKSTPAAATLPLRLSRPPLSRTSLRCLRSSAATNCAPPSSARSFLCRPMV